MIYLKNFRLLNEEQEYGIICSKKNIYNNLYPLKIFTEKNFELIDFAPITIFYGGNGSGKTTLLNIISTKLNASRKNINNKGELFDMYISRLPNISISNPDLKEIKLISSDDVFDYLLDLRAINSKVNRRKNDLGIEYFNTKYNHLDSNMATYEDLKNKVDANKMTASKYIRSRLTNNNIIEHSNGESALEFWQNEIQDHAIYLLDEPENSLSAENQIKLANFILDSARFYDCQFIISTHSPFLLSITDALIYDIDEVPTTTKKWTDLKNIQIYHDFFKSHENEFEKN